MKRRSSTKGKRTGAAVRAVHRVVDDRGVTYQQRYVLCGKKKCKRLHGPYWYASWKEGERVRTRYIGKKFRKLVRLVKPYRFAKPRAVRTIPKGLTGAEVRAKYVKRGEVYAYEPKTGRLLIEWPIEEQES